MVLASFYALGIFFTPLHSSEADDSAGDRECFFFARSGRFGFVNKHGDVVTAPKFEYSNGFSGWHHGFLWVREQAEDTMSGGFVNAAGRQVGKCRFGDVSSLNPGLPAPTYYGGVALVRLSEDEFGYVDEQGTVIGRAGRRGYSVMPDEQQLLAVMSDGIYGYADTSGKVVLPGRFDGVEGFVGDLACVYLDGKPRVLHRDGAIIGPSDVDWVGIASHPEQTFWISVNGKVGLADAQGEFLIGPQFDETAGFHEKRGNAAFVRVDDKWGLIDARGRVLVKPTFKTAKRIYKRDVARVTTDSGVGLLDYSGRLTVPCRFEDVLPFSKDVAFVKKDQKWGLRRGEEGFIVTPHFDDVIVHDESVALVRVSREWGAVTAKGAISITPKYDEIQRVGLANPGVAEMRVGKKWGLVNVITGAEILVPEYQYAHRWNDDLYSVRQGNVVGLVSCAGTWLVRTDTRVRTLPTPEQIVNDHGPIRAVGGTGLIRADGHIVLPCQYEGIGHMSEGLVPVKRGGKWGFVDTEGSVVIPPAFEDAKPFSEGVAAVKKDGRYGYIDRDGVFVVQPIYSDAGYCFNGRMPVAIRREGARGEGKHRWGLIDRKGNSVLALEQDCVEWGSIGPKDTEFYGDIGWNWL
jgi:hypothetical protein